MSLYIPRDLSCPFVYQEVARGPITRPFPPSQPHAGKAKTSGHPSKEASLSLWRPELPLPTLRVMLGPMSFREIQGKMELLGLQGLQDPLGPGALLATLGKMAPGEHQAQR